MKFIKGRVVDKKIWSDGLFTLRIEASGVLPFQPGQYLQVGVDFADKHVHRPYSVASPHGDVLDFFIVRVDEGRLTPTLWNLNAGDAIDVAEKALGSFTLKHVQDVEDIWLIGTGTGLAPYIAMLRDQTLWDRFKNVRVIHGVRYARDLAYQDEMAQYASMYPGRFAWLPIVSRESHEGMLSGRTTQALESGAMEEAAKLSFRPGNCSVMLCGNPDMLNEMESMLVARGLRKHSHKEPADIVIERYW
jgi:ferredoxin/flavodoxin---NADP+ reductase